MAERFLAFFGKQHHRALLGFTDEAIEALQQYAWPGNVRELHNVIERAAILCRGDRVGIEYLPDNITSPEVMPNIGDPISLEAVEELHIRRVLASSRSLQEAAETLGIDQATLWRRRKKYGI